MKKRITLLTTVALCATSLVLGAVASGLVKDIRAELRRDFTIEIDGKVRNFKNAQGDVVYPVLYDGTTYLPVRAIGELMGKTVYWYENDKRIELKDAKTTVTDADVIIGGADDKTEIAVSDKKDKDKEDKYDKKDKDDRYEKVDKSDFIGVEKAKEIALKEAGLNEDEVVFEKAELDEDDGIWEYEIEFKHGRNEYEADIAATDGKILGWSAEIED